MVLMVSFMAGLPPQQSRPNEYQVKPPVLETFYGREVWLWHKSLQHPYSRFLEKTERIPGILCIRPLGAHNTHFANDLILRTGHRHAQG